MTNLWNLIKIEFSKSFSKSSMKENKAKSASFITMVLLVIILGIVLSSLYSFIYGNVFIESNQSLVPLVLLFASVATMMTLFSGINQAKGIFLGKDYEMLSALPIKKSVIIASKVINLYAVELLYSSIIMIPNGVVSTVLTGDSIFIFMALILAVFISAFPLVIAMVFSFITAALSEKFKYGNFVSLAFYMVFLGALFFFSFSISKSGNVTEQANVLSSASNITKWINPALYFVNLAFVDNFLYVLIFIAIDVVSIIAVILVFALFYDKIHDAIYSMKANYKYERKYLKAKNELRSLLGLEFKRLITSKMYFLNSVVGLIMSLLLGIMASIALSKYSPFGVPEEIVNYANQYAFAGSLIIIFGVGVYNTCAVGISMEGANFWLVKTLPINYKKYMWAKILMALILNVPVCLIVSTTMVIFIAPNWISILAIFLIPILYVFLTVTVSLLLNLTFYKLKWSSEQEVVKSSSSVVISMFLGFGIDIVVAGLLLGLGVISVILGVLVTIGVLLASTIVFFTILSTTFEKKIMKIEEF